MQNVSLQSNPQEPEQQKTSLFEEKTKETRTETKTVVEEAATPQPLKQEEQYMTTQEAEKEKQMCIRDRYVI